MAITKGNIREFLAEKRQALYDSKVTPLKNELREIEYKTNHESFKKVQDSAKWDVEKFAKQFSKLAKEAALIRDDTGIYWGSVRDLSHYSGKTPQEIIDQIVSNYANNASSEITYPPRANELEVEIQDLETRIRDQFRKFEAMVCANSAKQCVTLLREAGFDVDDLENRFATPKNEVKALDIDNDLLGLPEQKKLEETTNE